MSELKMFWKLSLVVLTSALILSCSLTTIQKSYDSKLTSIIIVPGFKGSYLDNNDGDKIWVTARQALLGRDSLALNNPTIGISNIELRDGGLIRKVRVIPGIYNYDSYGTLVENLESEFGKHFNIVEFHYDWRQDNITSIKSLGALIEQKNRDGGRVYIIGHSMGAMIVSYYLRYGAQEFESARQTWEGAALVSKAVLAGGPFLGSAKMFRDMDLGSPLLLNKSLLSPEALCSFPSSYQLLPIYPGGVIANPDIDIFKADTWRARNWGCFKDANMPTDLTARRLEFVKDSLHRSQQFFSLLNNRDDQSSTRLNTKILNIVGRGRSTESQFNWSTAKGNFVFDQPLLEDGDGVVIVRSAQLLSAFERQFETTQAQVDADHDKLLSDPDGYKKVSAFLN